MRKGISTPVLIGLLTLVFILISTIAVNLGGGSSDDKLSVSEMFTVSYGEFDIRVPTTGELASNNQVSIRNLLDSNAVLVSLVDEGTVVQEGDVLFELNDNSIREDIRNSEMNVTSATNDVQNAETTLLISEKKRDSELATKQLAVDLANLALLAWSEGEVVARRQQLELSVQTADKNYQRLLKKYESSINLYEQKFLSKDELDQDEISLLNAEANLRGANLNVEVYENYTHKQEKQKKESDLQQAIDELDRSVDRLGSELRQAEANLVARKNQLTKREEQLAKREEQLTMCVVTSPASGMVVHATSLGERREEMERLRVGRSLFENQLVMIIPDPTDMVARVKINEALSGLVTAGQKATVVCDAHPDVVLKGEVTVVGILATGGGWRDPNRRDYTIDIKVEHQNEISLKPSMRCSADIFIERIEAQLRIPLHAVRRDGEIVWVWKEVSGGYAQHPIQTGKFSESYIVVAGGLEEGDVVLLRDPPMGGVVSRIDFEGSSS